jgi:hypothetical protein
VQDQAQVAPADLVPGVVVAQRPLANAQNRRAVPLYQAGERRLVLCRDEAPEQLRVEPVAICRRADPAEVAQRLAQRSNSYHPNLRRTRIKKGR